MCFLLQILPGVKVIIAHTETKGPLGDSHLGEASFFSLPFHTSTFVSLTKSSALCECVSPSMCFEFVHEQ